MADNFGVYDISGRVETVVSSPVERALEPLSGNLNIRRQPERELYNKILLGTALRSEVGQAQDVTSNQGMAVDGNTVALWRVDEPLSSSALVDEVASRQVQVFGKSVPEVVDGQIGYARWVSSSQGQDGVWLQGTGDATLGSLFSGSAWSIESWVNPHHEVAQGIIFIYNGLNFSLDNNHLILAQFVYFPTGSTGRIGFTQWQTPGATSNGYSSGTIASGSWSHVALTRELQVGGTPNRYTFKLYINGQLDSTHTNHVGQLVSTSGSGHFVGFGGYIGSAGFGTPSGAPFVGKMDEMRISNVIRTPAEILSSYQRGTGTVPQYTTVPSWTQTPIGKRHAFVINELSSSDHEVSSQNAFRSGTVGLEQSAVPASGSIYYTKQGRFQKITYKLSASANLPTLPGNLREPSQIENMPRNVFTATSGSYRNNSYSDPAVFMLDVPDYGRIRDVRVWVELIHDHRGGVGTGSNHAGNPFWAGGSGSNTTDTKVGLQGLQIALRSPNVQFPFSHPLWNEKTVVSFQKRPDENISAAHTAVPELLKSSYLLWAGHSVEKDLGMALGSATGSLPKGYTSSSIDTALQAPAHPAIVVDRNNQPVIVWCRHTGSTDYDMMIRRSFINGSSVAFATEKIGTANSPGDIGVQLGNDGVTPYVLLGDVSNFNLRLRVSGTGGWSNDLIDTRTFSSLDADFALDANNKVMVVSRGNDFITSLYVSSSAGWVKNPVGSNGPQAPTTSGQAIRCDSTGKFHFAFLDVKADGTPGIYYGTSSSAGLVGPTEVASVEAFDGQQLALALDRSNIPAIVYTGGSVFSGIRTYRSSSIGWDARTHVADIVSNLVGIKPKSAVYDRVGNLLADVSFRVVRGAGASSYAGIFRSGSNGVSFEMLGDKDRIPFGGNVMDVDSQGIAHCAVRDIGSIVSLTGDLFHVKRNFASGSDGKYHEYDTDIDMRTVFADSSRVQNPRHLQALYPQQTATSPGLSGQATERLNDGHSYPSPLSSSIAKFNYPWFEPAFFQDAWLTGANFPWMLDPRVPPGNFRGRNFSATASLGSSPPAGWLTGPAQTANTNEFTTTGSQIGPADIRPVYPLLDDVYVERVVPSTGTTGLESQLAGDRKIVGFRPGLRGTEVHGIWKLMIGNTADVNGAAVTGSERGGFWFRQFRLEFTIDTGRETRGTFPSRKRLYDRGAYVPKNSSNRTVSLISGSSAWDIGLNRVYTSQAEEYGRSLGITSNTGSTDFAVYSQLTGAFVTALGASGKLESVRASFLSNEFGTPYLPVTSGSGETPSFDALTSVDAVDSRQVYDEILSPTTLVPRDNTLRAFMARSRAAMSTRDSLVQRLKK